MSVQLATRGPDVTERLADLLSAAKRERPRSKAHGRCLGDFIDEKAYAHGLPVAEIQLLESLLDVTLCNVSGLDWRKQPDLEELKTNPDYRVRARLLRFLMLDGDEFVPVNESGLELSNAYIDGTIDLRGASCVKRVVLIDCCIDGALWIEDASLGILVIQQSRVAGVNGNRAKIAGTAFLEGLISENALQFYRAELGGNLQCAGAHISDGSQGSLLCSLTKIGGSVLLNDGFEVSGVRKPQRRPDRRQLTVHWHAYQR